MSLKKISSIFLGCIIAMPAMSGGVEEDFKYIESLYMHLHQNPELSLMETATSQRLAAEMHKLGFEVTENVGENGLVAVLKNGAGPTVLVRTDMDALPVKEQTNLSYASDHMRVDYLGKTVPAMHACGHDIHMASWVGTARQLTDRKDEWKGTLVMIAQPAEELGAGAKAMLDDGLFERFPRPDYNLALHAIPQLPTGYVAYAPEYAMASVDSVDITVYGSGGHGAAPHETNDPIVMASQIVMALQTIASREINPTDPVVVTVGSFHAGTKHNIISAEASLQLTVRSYSDEVRDKVLASIERIATNIARSAGMPEDRLPKVEINRDLPFLPATYNDPNLTAKVVKSLQNKLGHDKVFKIGPAMAGEDFSHYGRIAPKIPSFIFWLGTTDPLRFQEYKASGKQIPSLHSALYYPDRNSLKVGVEAMTTMVLDLFD